MDEQDPANALDSDLVKAIIGILESTNSPAIQRSREVIAHRLAISGDIAPSRIPPPRNITEIGGYINLLTEYEQEEQRARMLAAALGIAGPRVNLPQPGVLPPLSFAVREQVRPEGPAQATLPLSFSMRSDFIGAFDQALATVAEAGAALPVLSPLRVLPALGSALPGAEAQLDLIGRSLLLAPTAALSDPASDALSFSRRAAEGGFMVLARVFNEEAPGAAAIVAEDWISWSCTASECTEVETNDARLEVTPMLNAVGWYQPEVPENPVTSSAPGNWNRWQNITGLVPGQTTLGEELHALYPGDQVLASSLRDALELVWDGAAFT